MPLINYIDHKGNQFEAEVDVGQSVMEGAVNNGIDGILGECGGCLSCATCHVYVDEAWVSKTAAPEDFEKSLLDLVTDPQDNSRLSCQIEVKEDMDGFTVRMPANQF